MRKFRLSDKLNNPVGICLIIAFFFVCFLSVGFASLHANLTISQIKAGVRKNAIVRVTNAITTGTTNSGVVNKVDYDVTSLLTTVTLPNQQATASYDVTIKNIGEVRIFIGYFQ